MTAMEKVRSGRVLELSEDVNEEMAQVHSEWEFVCLELDKEPWEPGGEMPLSELRWVIKHLGFALGNAVEIEHLIVEARKELLQ